MNDDTRHAIADVALLGAAALGVYYIAKNPPLRRAAWQLLKFGLFTIGPELLRREVTQAWTDADPANRSSNLATGRSAVRY